MSLFKRSKDKPAAPPPGGVVTVANTHLYLGAAGRLPEDVGVEEPRAVRVEFSDGVEAAGTLAPMPGGRRRLEIAGYRTLKGASIAAKSWILMLNPEDPGAFKVRARGD